MSQKEDKARIYNSKEWQQLRAAKLQANPLCEMCMANGYVVSARVVHHITPIETARNYREMWQLAIGCGLNGLQSLCFQHHSDIHKALESRTRAAHQQSTTNAVERWVAEHRSTSETSPASFNPEEENNPK